MKDNRHEPAMPKITGPGTINYGGLTKAEYAALVTGQPCSGTPWLDEMIRAQRRERLAGQALAGMLANPTCRGADGMMSVLASCAEDYADALIAALEGDEE